MIKELFIQNFAIIDKISISFNNGMTVLTGETGAGKSIIIDAIGQLIGNRTNTSLVKKGTDKAIVEATIDPNTALIQKLNEFGLECDDEYVTITKEIYQSGKGMCRINGRVVSGSLLKEIMSTFIDIHSQFDTQDLLNPKNYMIIIDSYHAEQINELLTQYRFKYEQYIELKNKLEKLENEEQNLEQLEFYQTQLNEINQFDFENDSVEKLENEQLKMKSYEKIQKQISIFSKLSSDEYGFMSNLSNAIDAIKNISDIESFNTYYQELNDTYYRLNDLVESIYDTYQSLDYDEDRYNLIQEKLFVIQKLRKKYSPSIQTIIEKKKEIENHIHFLNHKDELMSKMYLELDQLKNECNQLADQLHEIRIDTASKISAKITEELHHLHMENAIFKIEVTTTKLNQNGYDNILFLISTNKGEDLKPIATIASGGELSRIMLSLKTVLISKTPIECIIFDEVDTGVSGKVAYAIGQKMKKISNSKQVLCITHLPQVACFANQHLYVEKTTINNNTSTNTRYLNKEQVINELATMISGSTVSKSALLQAKNLLQTKNDF